MSDQLEATRQVRHRVFPEAKAGGFTHVDGTLEFYGRVNALLPPDATVVDIGAGRGAFVEDQIPYRRELRRLQGKAARLVGLDVDPVVLQNPTVDEAYILREGHPFPLADASTDLIVSDWTFEHIDDPEHTAREMERILRPGGWLCARTPNKWGYIGVAARAVPNRYHDRVLRRVQPTKQSRDTFPTRYRLNTISDLERHFPPDRFLHCTYAMDSEPAYFAASEAAWRAAMVMFKVAPTRCRSVLYVFVQRRH